MIFAFEGIDGAGKTTLLEKVYDELKARGVRVFKTYEPFGDNRFVKVTEDDMTYLANTDYIVWIIP